jgi:hypothetical protein
MRAPFALDGGYRAFAELAERGGYQVRANAGPLDREALEETDLLVIVNARGGYGSGRSNTASTTLNMAVVPPIPRASVATA